MDNKTDNMEDIYPSAPSYEDAMKCSTVPPVPNESISWQLQQPPMNVGQIQSQPQPIQHQSQLVQHIPAMVRSKFRILGQSNLNLAKIMNINVKHNLTNLMNVLDVRIDGMFPVTCKWCQSPLETRVEHFSTTCTHITYLFIGLIL